MKRLITVLALFLVVTNAFSQKGIEAVIKQRPHRLVNDHVKALTATENRSLEKKLVDFNNRTSTQIAVVLVKSLDGLAIEDAALKLFNTWGIGQKDKNNGLLILAAIQDRKVRIEVGKGLTTAITNETAAEIIQEQIVPNFKESKYYQGLDEATNYLMQFALQVFPDTTAALQNSTNAEQQPIIESRPPSYDYAQQNTYVSETRSGLTGGITIAIIFVILIFAIVIIAAVMRNRNTGNVYSGGGYSSYNSTGTGSSGRGIFGGLIGGLFGGYLLSQWFNSNRNDQNNNDNWNNNNSGNFNGGDYSSGSSDFGGFGGGSSDAGSGGSDFGGGADSGGGASGDW